MPNTHTTLLCGVFLCSALSAQSGIGWVDQDLTTPGVQPWKLSDYFTFKKGTGSLKTMGDITSPAPIWLSTATTAALIQVSMGKTGLPGLKAGEFHMCLTTTNLDPYYGGSGALQQVILGTVTWNSGLPVFTPTTDAKNMNTTAGNVFGLMLDGKDGKLAAVDWPSGVMLSYRTSNAVPFPAPVLVSGISGTYVDPAPAHVDGKEVIFWMSGGNIVYGLLTRTMDTSNTTLLSASVGATFTVIAAGGRTHHSPTPLFDKNGNALGMWFSSRIGNDSDQYFAGSLDSTTLYTSEWDNAANWVNNGGVAGSRFLAASNVADGYYGRLLEGQGTYVTTNSDITVSSAATLTVAAGTRSAPAVPLTQTNLAVSLGVVPPVALPGILGTFGLHTVTMLFPIATVVSLNQDDFAQLSFPATDPTLKGNSIYLQGLGIATSMTLEPALSNTVKVTFR